jgi:tight adherence protein B
MSLRRELGTMSALLLVAALLLAFAAPAGAAGLQLSEAQSATFPERTFVLSLPQKQSLSPAQVHVTENGRDVLRPHVTPGTEAGTRGFGVVLAIDSSESMHGKAIADAMAAARTFAGKRSPNLEVGVVLFNHDAAVALPLTADANKIDQVLAQTPQLHKGTRIYDATALAIRQLVAGKVSAGSVLVLSDGADVGSQLSAAAVTSAARHAHVRVFTVGLRSPSFDSTALRALAHTGGAYAEAASSKDLGRIYGALAQQFSNEYLLTYKSLAPLGAPVSVAVDVDGVGRATASYTAPVLPKSALPAAEVGGFWGSSIAVVVVTLLGALLIAWIVFAVSRLFRPDVRSRIAEFVPDRGTDEDVQSAGQRRQSQLLVDAERQLAKTDWWGRFKEDVDVAKIQMPPIQILALTTAATVFLVWVGAVPAANPALAVLFALTPVGVHVAITTLANRQRRQFDAQLSDNLQVIASAMRAGHSFIGAMSVAVEDASEPAKSELRTVVREEQLGIPLDQACASVARRMRSEEFEYVGLVAMLQRETGGNTAEVLDRVTETIRERFDLRRLVRTLTAQGRLGGIIVSALPVALIGIISIADPEYLQPLLHTSGGRVLLAAGVVLMAIGWIAIRRIIDIKV